ncbi:cAMP-dependent protein kinase catalytic subunit-like [Tropilaelaps mercedesae]|uniref:cAMP-dependent protein kinase catalytic subunit-like n=1 Tax=Tropilaelaps mercedesae TaxID=418985 RepID=A0A1V9Y3B4_9ACAR|nr:cAMP-dependent protein kinase catalytic subunit-like [Tropilaelaps mercedesae]
MILEVRHEQENLFYAMKVAFALEFLHAINIVHRDVIASNVLIAHDGYLKLAGFKNAKVVLGSDKTYTIVGHVSCNAPEMLNKRSGYGRLVDWWALGVLVYRLLYGLDAFNSLPTQIGDKIHTVAAGHESDETHGDVISPS